MLAYAARRPFADRQSSPNALILIVGGHLVALGLLMTARMELPVHHNNDPIDIAYVPTPRDPPPNEVTRRSDPAPSHQTTIDRQIAIPRDPGPSLDSDPTPDPGPSLGSGTGTGTGGNALPKLPPPVLKLAPELITPASQLKPPYPMSKQAAGEEATLTLLLRIDEAGRVTAVEPVGRADRIFLEAARRHLIAHWRYRPASEGGRAVASSSVISLSFRLEE